MLNLHSKLHRAEIHKNIKKTTTTKNKFNEQKTVTHMVIFKQTRHNHL